MQQREEERVKRQAMVDEANADLARARANPKRGPGHISLAGLKNLLASFTAAASAVASLRAEKKRREETKEAILRDGIVDDGSEESELVQCQAWLQLYPTRIDTALQAERRALAALVHEADAIRQPWNRAARAAMDRKREEYRTALAPFYLTKTRLLTDVVRTAHLPVVAQLRDAQWHEAGTSLNSELALAWVGTGIERIEKFAAAMDVTLDPEK